MNNTNPASPVLAAANDTLSDGMRKIEHCVAQLSDAQLWWRPQPIEVAANQAPASLAGSTQPVEYRPDTAEMNSIANLLLHLSGNVRQWIVAGVGGSKDIRNRPLEFADRSQRSKAEVLGILQATVKDAKAAIAGVQPDELAAARHIQGADTNVSAALFKCISHFMGHVQEIIHMTRVQLGDKYRYDLIPKGAEQISAGGK
ncbi:MAG TPA: DUF1572 family protein [Pirellulales bacterium]|jgi:hypothetical protein